MNDKITSIRDIVVAAFLECRSEGHAWGKVNDKVTANRGFISQFVRMKTCGRCGLEKETTYQIEGLDVRPVKSKSYYPDGYVVHGVGRIHASEVRIEQLVRAGYKVRGYK